MPTPPDTKGINKATFLRVASAVLRSDGISRSSLAKLCDISAVSAGKVVSAMLESDLAVPQKLASSGGRSAELIFPSPSLRATVIFAGEDRIRISVCELSGKECFSHSRPIDHSLDYKDNLLCVARSSQVILSKEASHTCGALVVCENDGLKKELYSSLSELLFLPSPIITTYEECVTSCLAQRYRDKNLLLLRISPTLRPMLFCGGSRISTKRTEPYRLSGLDELSLVKKLADTLTPFFDIIIPDKIIIDSEIFSVDKMLLSALSRELLRRRPSRAEEAPELFSLSEPPLVTLAALDMLAESTLKKLTEEL